MRKTLKWLGIGLGALAAVALVGLTVLYFVGGAKVDRTYTIQTAALDIPTDSAAVARGAHIAAINGCTDCHGEDLGGRVFADAPPFRVTASNLTSGQGGVANYYDDADWDRAIRHGVKPDGRSVFIMPSAAFHQLSDRDVADLIAFLRSVPPVDRELEPTEVRAPGRILSAFAIDPGMEVRDTPARKDAPPPGPTAEYGAYLTSITCAYCHGADLRGAQPPIPESPPAPDLATAGGWPLDLFVDVVRTGQMPGGRELDPEFMPIALTAAMTDDELTAIHTHLATLADRTPTRQAVEG